MKPTLKDAEQKPGEKPTPMTTFEPLDPATPKAPSWAFQSMEFPFLMSNFPETKSQLIQMQLMLEVRVVCPSLTHGQCAKDRTFSSSSLICFLCHPHGQAWFPRFRTLMGSKLFCFRDFVLMVPIMRGFASPSMKTCTICSMRV